MFKFFDAQEVLALNIYFPIKSNKTSASLIFYLLLALNEEISDINKKKRTLKYVFL